MERIVALSVVGGDRALHLMRVPRKHDLDNFVMGGTLGLLRQDAQICTAGERPGREELHYNGKGEEKRTRESERVSELSATRDVAKQAELDSEANEERSDELASPGTRFLQIVSTGVVPVLSIGIPVLRCRQLRRRSLFLIGLRTHAVGGAAANAASHLSGLGYRASLILLRYHATARENPTPGSLYRQLQSS